MPSNAGTRLSLVVAFIAISAVACGSGGVDDAERFERFTEAVDSGAGCDELIRLGNEITAGSPELVWANERLAETDCPGPSTLRSRRNGSSAGPPADTAPGAAGTDGAGATSSTPSVEAASSTESAPAIEVFDPDHPESTETEVTGVLGPNRLEIEGGWAVRLIGLDVSDECVAAEARRMLVALAGPGTTVEIGYGHRQFDDEGNALAYVTRAEDDLDVNGTMLARGAARGAFSLDELDRSARLRDLAAAAEATGRGVWSTC